MQTAGPSAQNGSRSMTRLRSSFSSVRTEVTQWCHGAPVVSLAHCAAVSIASCHDSTDHTTLSAAARNADVASLLVCCSRLKHTSHDYTWCIGAGPMGRVPSNFGELGTNFIWSCPTFISGCHCRFTRCSITDSRCISD